MGAIKSHKTSVDKTGSWDGPKAVADAPNEAATLRYMHAWVNEKGDPDAKGSYKFPHHRPGTDTPAVIAGVNNVLARLSQATIPVGDRSGVEAHLRKHRKDAGLEESMSEVEIAETVKFIKKMDDLKADEAKALTESIKLQEISNLGTWIQARCYGTMSSMATDMLGGGNINRTEHKVLMDCAGMMMNMCNEQLLQNAPQLFQRRPWQDAPEDGAQPVAEAATIKSKARSAARALKNLLADKTLPKELHDGVEGLVTALQKTWADLAADTEGDPPAAEAASPHLENHKMGEEFEIEGDFVPLIEKAVRRDGTIPLKIIQPGWGSSGFYPAEVLKRDGPQIFTKDTKMYWNHQTHQEEAERPEGDLNNLAAVFVNDARWMDNGPRGAGLYGDAKVFEAFQKPVDDLAGHIGVSIRAFGKAQQGTVEGKTGPVITELASRKSVDFVTEPGAGGEIITMFEAARKPLAVGGQQSADADKTNAGPVPAEEATHNVANSKSTMEEEMEIKELQEKVATLETNNQSLATNNARLSEAMALRDAKDMVKEALAAVASLPDVTKARLIESLAKNPPMKDGVLDKEAFTKAIQEAVKAEVKYLETVLGKGQIRDLGESQNEDEEGEAADKKVEESLTESFSALGLSEKGAKIAARGRQ